MADGSQPSPIFRIRLGERDITNTFADRLESLTVTENRGPEADQLDIVLIDSDGQLEIPQRGVKVSVAIGWQASGLVDKGTFIIDDVEHTGSPDKLTLRGRSADLRAGLTTQKERSWHEVTLGDIVKSIATGNLLKAIIPVQLANQPIAHIDQTNESDINLLQRLANMFDAIATVKNGNLLFMKMGLSLSAGGIALPGVTITRADGDQHRFAIADRDTYTAVKALYQDVGLAIKGEVVIDEGNVTGEPVATPSAPVITPDGRVFTLTHLYLSKSSAERAARSKYRDLREGQTIYSSVQAYYRDDRTGAKVLVSITAENVNVDDGPDALATDIGEAPAPLTASADNIKTLRHVYSNKANAARAARAEFERIKRGTSTFSLALALGRPDIFPEVPVIVSGWKPSIDSTSWIVTRATHSLTDAAGLITRLEMELRLSEQVD